MENTIQKDSSIQKWEVDKAENQLSRLAHQWDRSVLKALARLGQSHWPDRHLLRIIPVHTHRIRRKVTPDAYVWWVEFDIPPYDRFRCAAYQVRLTLDGAGKGVLSLRTGLKEYLIRPPISKTLDDLLHTVQQDQPLIISRDFGPAWD
jgi:hypothetical protein